MPPPTPLFLRYPPIYVGGRVLRLRYAYVYCSRLDASRRCGLLPGTDCTLDRLDARFNEFRALYAHQRSEKKIGPNTCKSDLEKMEQTKQAVKVPTLECRSENRVRTRRARLILDAPPAAAVTQRRLPIITLSRVQVYQWRFN